FVGPSVCRRLPSDSTSRWTPLSLANTSHCKGVFGTYTLELLLMLGTQKNGANFLCPAISSMVIFFVRDLSCYTDICRIKAFLTLLDIVSYAIVFTDVAHESCRVDKNISTAICGCDKTETFSFVKEFYCSFLHCIIVLLINYSIIVLSAPESRSVFGFLPASVSHLHCRMKRLSLHFPPVRYVLYGVRMSRNLLGDRS